VIQLKVEGMTCKHCVMAVTNALKSVPGVKRVAEVSWERGEARIEGEPDRAALVKAVEDEGYRASVLG
jgi:copper chaperone